MTRKENNAFERMCCILTDEQLKRFCFMDAEESDLTLCVDLHGLTCQEARRLIDIIQLLVRDDFVLLIVHGYSHGQSIKDMLWYQYDNRRLRYKWADDENPGLTYFRVA